jgi:hypothetical protein
MREIWQVEQIRLRRISVKKSQFTEQQIAFALQHVETGTEVGYVARWGSASRRSVAARSSSPDWRSTRFVR